MSGCIFCGKSISIPLSLSFIFSLKKIGKPLICRTCLSFFNRIDLEFACSGCSRVQNGRTLCSDCKKWKEKGPNLELNHTALFKYNEMAKEYMKQFKFQGDLVLSELFSKEIVKFLANCQSTHHIVPIPISEKSMEERGFNQVNLILEKSGIHYESWLSHIGGGQRQSSKSRIDRLSSDQFIAVNLDFREFQQITKPILIVDDVYTTGRTILHAKDAFHTFEEKGKKLYPKKDSRQIMKIESFSIFR